MVFLQALLPAFPAHGKSYPPEAIKHLKKHPTAKKKGSPAGLPFSFASM
jgi:hypothetical protein